MVRVLKWGGTLARTSDTGGVHHAESACRRATELPRVACAFVFKKKVRSMWVCIQHDTFVLAPPPSLPHTQPIQKGVRWTMKWGVAL